MERSLNKQNLKFVCTFYHKLAYTKETHYFFAYA